MKHGIVVLFLASLLACCAGCAGRPGAVRGGVFGGTDPQSIITSLQDENTKVLLAWFGDEGLKERVVSNQKDKRVVLIWLANSMHVLCSIGSSREEPLARRPWWEMSVYEGDNPWGPSAKRIAIYDKSSLSHDTFREIQDFFEKTGKQAPNQVQ
jgi:hypothetical protein